LNTQGTDVKDVEMIDVNNESGSLDTKKKQKQPPNWYSDDDPEEAQLEKSLTSQRESEWVTTPKRGEKSKSNLLLGQSGPGTLGTLTDYKVKPARSPRKESHTAKKFQRKEPIIPECLPNNRFSALADNMQLSKDSITDPASSTIQDLMPTTSEEASDTEYHIEKSESGGDGSLSSAFASLSDDEKQETLLLTQDPSNESGVRMASTNATQRIQEYYSASAAIQNQFWLGSEVTQHPESNIPIQQSSSLPSSAQQTSTPHSTPGPTQYNLQSGTSGEDSG
jgi:hypothetical protein